MKSIRGRKFNPSTIIITCVAFITHKNKHTSKDLVYADIKDGWQEYFETKERIYNRFQNKMKIFFKTNRIFL